MKNIFRAVTQAPKRYGIAAIIAAVAVVPATIFAWGPDRPTYTVANPAQEVTFNSITDNPNYGDERNFVTVKDPATGNFTDKVTVEPGKEYEVRVLVHNNAADTLNLKAVNTTLKTAISPNVAKKNAITGYVSADNANPAKIHDDVYFESDKNFNLAYVDGTARVYNSGYAAGGEGKAVSSSLFTQQGFKLGYAAEGDGIIPGCFKYINYVYFKVKPQFEQTADFAVQKKVSKADKNEWKDTMSVTAGETVDYRIEYKNTGEVQQNNVVVKDKLPANVSYVAGTTKLYNAQNPNGKVLTDEVTTDKGVNIGSHSKGANSFVVFKAKIAEAAKLTCGMNKLVNTARVITDYGVKEDVVDVTVEKKCEEQPTKIEVCDLATKKVILIDAKQFDDSKHSRDLDDCKEAPVTPVEKNIEVCDLDTKKLVVIKESEFDDSKHSKDMTVCKEAPVVPETPVEETPVAELPKTGAVDLVSAGIALGSLVAATGYAIASRRRLL
jgi:uncharacterized repeat protein (TIGR01451 family)